MNVRWRPAAPGAYAAQSVALVALLSAGTGCSDSPSQGTTPQLGPVSYQKDLRPIIEASCVGCHVAGGSAPFALDGWQDVRNAGPALVNAVESRRMPPWQPDPDCQPHLDPRRLSEDQISRFLAWQAQGYPEGDVADYVPPERPSSTIDRSPDLALKAGGLYRPGTETSDDYRCLPLVQEFSQDTYITALDVRPDKAEMVHHVLVYLVEPELVAEMEQLDAEDAGTGYTCFGSPRVSLTTVGGWVPGGQPQVFPENAAFVVPAGARLVMQVHYFTPNLGGAIPEDQSELLLWTLAPGQVPEKRVRITPLPQLNFRLPAGDPRVEVKFQAKVPTRLTVIGDSPHMHGLGSSFRMEILKPGGGKQCLSHIPEWDFAWQQFYAFDPASYVTLETGDVLNMTCVYDNSAANQPVVAGVQQAPREVRWGDSSLDEMCLYYMVTMEDFTGSASSCRPFTDCFQSCTQGLSLVECIFSCAVIFPDLQCIETCFPEQLLACTESVCSTAYSAVKNCADNSGCAVDDINCLTNRCGPQLGILVIPCIQPRIADGTCAPYFDECS